MSDEWVLTSSDPLQLKQILEGLKLRFQNVLGSVEARPAYFDAIDYAEGQLASFVEGVGWLDGLHTPRYWDIQRTSLGSYQPVAQIHREIEHQLQRIDRLLRRLGPVIDQETEGNQRATRAVLDTNVHLHYQPFNEIDWSRVLNATTVRLIVPLHVIRELDEKKNYSSAKLSSRAAARLKLLRRTLASDGRGPVPIPGRQRVFVEVPYGFDSLPQRDADGAIVETALALSQRPGATVRLVTGDLSMQLRASALGLDVSAMPNDYRQPLESDDGKNVGDDRSDTTS